MKGYILILFLTIGVFAKAQKYDAPILSNGEEEYTLGKINNLSRMFFVADSAWLYVESNDYKIHSFEIVVNPDKTPYRYYGANGIIKGACLRKILTIAPPMLLEISKIKIMFNNDFLVLPDKYLLFVN